LPRAIIHIISPMPTGQASTASGVKVEAMVAICIKGVPVFGDITMQHSSEPEHGQPDEQRGLSTRAMRLEP